MPTDEGSAVNDHAQDPVADAISEPVETDDAVRAPDDPVHDAVDRLGELDSTDVSEHPAIYEDIHRSLASALDDTPTTQADQ